MVNHVSAKPDTPSESDSTGFGISANGRVYAELLRLAGDTHRIAPPPVLSALALTVHTTRETASRAIASLARRGIVRRTDEALEIVAPRLLAELIA